MVRAGNVLLEGDPAANGGKGVLVPANVLHTGHAFLNDIAHNAVPNPGLIVGADNVILRLPQQDLHHCSGTYDGDVLDAHFVTGDGRGNENIALTMVHKIFHAEHNRLVHHIDGLINTRHDARPRSPAWHAVDTGSGWGYGERLFQAARFVTEMEYQHLVFEEFARKMQPLINPFLGGITSIDAAISAEFAQRSIASATRCCPRWWAHQHQRIARRCPPAQRIPQSGPVQRRRDGDAADRGGGRRGHHPRHGSPDRKRARRVRDLLGPEQAGWPAARPAGDQHRARPQRRHPVAERGAGAVLRRHPGLGASPYGNWTEFGLDLKHRSRS